LYYKTDTLTTPTFLKKCEKSNRGYIKGRREYNFNGFRFGQFVSLVLLVNFDQINACMACHVCK